MNPDFKLLIFMKESQLSPRGGPQGYCYNIKQEIDKKEIKNISFLPSDSEKRNDIITVSFKTKIVIFIQKYLKFIWNIKFFSSLVRNNGQSSIDKTYLNGFDFIHFHSTIDLYKNRSIRNNYSGKIILTSHSPIPTFKEIINERTTIIERFFFSWLYKRTNKVDITAFDIADYIIFPCREAEESYYKNWKYYKILKERNAHKYRYVLTGINKCIPKTYPENILNTIGLNNNNFLVSYVGRHNKIKGYKRLKTIGKTIKNRRIHFVICGKEYPIKGIKSLQWHEIGWTNDAYSFINACDIFLLPNIETYFDIVLLEALSLGKVVVASKTGGNKVFEKKSKGIFLFDSTDEAIRIINFLSLKSKDELNALGNENMQLFEKSFSISIFMKNYLYLLSELKNEQERKKSI